MAFKELASKPVTTTFKFMGEDITVQKLTISQVIELQNMGKNSKPEDSAIDVLFFAIKAGVPEARSMTREEFNDFSIDELSKLSNFIMEYSGLGNVNS